MKLEPIKNRLVSLRINQRDYAILVEVAKFTGQKSVSQLIRSLCNISINAYKYQQESVKHENL